MVNTSGKIPPCNPQNMKVNTKVKDRTICDAGINNNQKSLNSLETSGKIDGRLKTTL